MIKALSVEFDLVSIQIRWWWLVLITSFSCNIKACMFPRQPEKSPRRCELAITNTSL